MWRMIENENQRANLHEDSQGTLGNMTENGFVLEDENDTKGWKLWGMLGILGIRLNGDEIEMAHKDMIFSLDSLSRLLL